MATAQQGNTVRVHYTGTLDDGTVFDSSYQRDEPIEFAIGQGDMIPGFEKAVVGMEVGDKKTANLPAAEAYGEQDPEMLINIPQQDIPDEINPEVGQQLAVQDNTGQQVPVTVVEVNEEGIVLDGNHPLAGKDLTFEIEMVEIR